MVSGIIFSFCDMHPLICLVMGCTGTLSRDSVRRSRGLHCRMGLQGYLLILSEQTRRIFPRSSWTLCNISTIPERRLRPGVKAPG